ncbi:MAG: hypothetical protein AAFU53_10865, partial [Cyanobacteria bacterium J06632_3]
VLVFPTLEEVWGLVVNEALWSDLPVVSSVYAGCAPEILPKENLFDPLDPVSFESILVKAVTGKLAPPSTDCLSTSEQVVQQIFKRIIDLSPAINTKLVSSEQVSLP